MIKKKLIVEMNANFAQSSDVLTDGKNTIVMTPPLDEDFWIARVRLHRKQAIVAFPKFFTVGCGFSQEEDWNTNLPLSMPANEIFAHIKHNKKHKEIKNADCVKAIELLQQSVLPLWKKAQGASR